jgi:FkbM family methyltransferase
MFFVDGRSCALQHRVIFEHRIYAMLCDHANPRTIDAGANIGMAALFFRRLFPSAKIDAFEADPGIVQVLRQNVDSFGLHDVEVHHAAVSDKTGTVQFVSTGLDSRYVSKLANQASMAVPAVRLRDWLDEPIDFLKLDIEGAECDVIIGCLSHLKNVSRIFVEYHSLAAERQQLPEMLANPRDAGFRIFIQTDYCAPCPLLDPASYSAMDLRLNVFERR